MGLPLHLLLPLAAAVVFVAGALLVKRASDLGADVWRTTRIINYTTALVATPLFLLGGTIPPASLWWQPAVAGSLFFSGQVFSLLALTTGDVSVTTPVLGVKILLVAILTAALIGDPIGSRLWTAAALSSAAIALLNAGGSPPHKRVGTTIGLAALGATGYACFEYWSRSGRPYGGRATSCRWRWRVPRHIQFLFGGSISREEHRANTPRPPILLGSLRARWLLRCKG